MPSGDAACTTSTKYVSEASTVSVCARSATAFNKMGEKHEGEEKALIKLEGAITESRSDTAQTLAAAREARDIVIERIPQRRTGQRPATSGGA